jgi:DNA-binding NtrC family response regulator
VSSKLESTPPRSLRSLLASLREATTFEAAAEVVLDHLFRICDAAARPRYRRNIVQRATLHLRPSGGYQGLFFGTYADAADVSEEAASDSTWLSSLTAWKYVSQGLAPLEIDLERGVFVRLFPGAARQPEPEESLADFDSNRTLTVMRSRKTTHLLVLPVLGVPSSVLGQICIEVRCAGAIHTPYMWLDCLDELSDVVSLASPYIASLPPESEREGAQINDFPVVGKAMAPILRTLRTFARHNETILLRGTTGTGKSRLARWCHDSSSRAGKPFEVVALSAVAPDLQVSTLFGWRKGAFTGATSSGVGALQRAKGGTLFLDEIDKLDLSVQKSLLRLIEDKRFLAIGAEKEEEADVRFIVGTNADLERATKEGRFLLDLYYRINVLPVCLPTLAERRDEIAPWARFMVKRCVSEVSPGLSVTLAEDAEQSLEAFTWPGNLRQLDNVVRRALMLTLAELGDERATHAVVSRAHVEAALVMEHSGRPSHESAPVIDTLRASARALVEGMAANDGDAAAEIFDLAGNAFRGMVLLEAVAQFSDPKKAFEVLGKTKALESRNHQRMLSMARKHVEALQARLNDPSVRRG